MTMAVMYGCGLQSRHVSDDWNMDFLRLNYFVSECPSYVKTKAAISAAWYIIQWVTRKWHSRQWLTGVVTRWGCLSNNLHFVVKFHIRLWFLGGFVDSFRHHALFGPVVLPQSTQDLYCNQVPSVLRDQPNDKQTVPPEIVFGKAPDK